MYLLSKLTLFLRFTIQILVVILSLLPFAASPHEKPQKMSMSYIGHPVIINELIPLIKKTYQQLGIATEFTEQPSAKNLRLVSEGVSDAEVAYSELLLEGYPNLVMVGPPLVTSVFVLLCDVNVPCEKSYLSRPDTTLVLTAASLTGMKIKYGKTFKNQPYVIKRLQDVPKLLTEQRFTRGIYVVTDRNLGLAGFEGLKYTELFTTGTFHIINSKFEFMKDDIDLAIRQALKEKEALSAPRG